MGPFLSKDTSLPDSSSKVFQSAEFFSNLFQDWESKTSMEDVKATAQELLKNNSLMVKKEDGKDPFVENEDENDEDEDFASLKDTWKSEEWAPRTLDLSQASVSPSIFDDEDKKVEEEEFDAPPVLEDIFTSREWGQTLGAHKDISNYNPSVLFDEAADENVLFDEAANENVLFDEATDENTHASLPKHSITDENKGTNWEELYVQQLLSSTALTANATAAQDANKTVPKNDTMVKPKKKRVRKPRKKVVPKHKQYVTPNKDLDVLSGRGGRSNHWPGNKRYREEIENRKAWYKLVDKDDKTKLAQDLVDYIKTYKGRFLQLDDVGWYIQPNIVARRKVSQALREDSDPEKRAKKRARYLERQGRHAIGLGY